MQVSTRIALKYIFTLRKFHFITVITVISFIGIVVGVAALICVVSIFNGFREFTEQQLIAFDPHIRVSAARGAWLNDADSLVKKIQAMKEVESASPVIQGRTVILNKSSMQVTLMNAVKGKEIKTVSGISKRMVIGGFYVGYHDELPGLVIGTGLADRLKTLPGDTVYIMSPEMIEESIRLFRRSGGIRVLVTGIFQTGAKEYDESYSYVSEDIGRMLFNTPAGAAYSIDIRLKNIENVNKVKDELGKIIPKDATIYTWYDLHKELYNVMQFERLASFIVLSLIIMIAVFNVLASLSMTVVEKQSDIATLKAIGGSDSFIQNIYMKEGIIIGIISTFIGTLAGLGLAFGQIRYGWFKLDTTKYLIDAIPVSVHAFDVIVIIAFALLLSFLATIYPARRAAKTSVVQALREE